MTRPRPFISLQNVSIRVHEHVVFERLSWEMFDDQHWAVIGPNASGKSVLMKALSGSLPVIKGRIVYHFLESVAEPSVSDHIVHVSFEDQRTLLPHETFVQDRWNIGLSEDGLTVSDLLSEENINRTNRFELTERKADPTFATRKRKVIKQMELRPLLKRKVIQLSNGERRKVAIAQALLKNPKLLILDNPFEGLDERFRKKLLKTLAMLMRGKMCIMIIGTSRDEIPSGITHIFLIKEDRSILQGPRKTMLKSIRSEDSGKLPVSVRKKAGAKAGEILVQMRKVNVSYDGRQILRNINWTIREHERWALLGPNGAGKTTLLSLIIADNPQAYANDIMLFGKRRGSGESIWEIKRNIGWVAPELQLYYPSRLTCLDVACSGWFDSIGLYRECTDDQREIALALLQKFGVAERAGEMFADVSEGEQRLTLLARAIVKSPRLLILDEPCQGLDSEHRDRVLEAIDSIEKETTTMIYVTHRADELPKSITHIVRLETAR